MNVQFFKDVKLQEGSLRLSILTVTEVLGEIAMRCHASTKPKTGNYSISTAAFFFRFGAGADRGD